MPGDPEPADRPGSAVEVVLPPAPGSVASARHAVADLLAGSTVPVPDVVVEDILLLVSELVTNAVLHARTSTRVRASLEPGRVVVGVGDDDPHHAPFLAERGTAATNGRGVMLVDALASDWGIDLRPTSKVVWFTTAYEPGGVPGDGGGRTQHPKGRPAPRRPLIRRSPRPA